MKPVYWIIIAVIFLIVIGYAIYAWQKGQEEERKLEAAKLAAENFGDTPEEKTNIWKIIAGITGVLGDQNVGYNRA